MSALTILTGPAASGCREELYRRAADSARGGKETIVIVPEQATFGAERRLAEMMDGFIGLEVLSMKRLTERILEETGRKRPYLSEQGIAMATRRVAEANAAELTVYAGAVGKKGFCGELSGLFQKFKRALIAPEELRNADIKGSPLMHDKLADIALLYEKTNAWLGERYLTEDDGINRAAKLIPFSSVKGADVYIDLDGGPFKSAQFRMLFSAVLLAARSVTVSVAADPAGIALPLFLPAVQLLDCIRSCAADCGVSVTEKSFEESLDRPAALAYAGGSVFRLPGEPFAGDVSPVEIHALPNRAREAELVADRVLELARGGMRYREMAVLFSDASYAPLLNRSFSLRGIPLYLDEKRPLVSFAAADTAVAALTAVVNNYRTQDILRLAKTGFAGVDENGASALENYCLKYGIRRGMFQRPFERGTVWRGEGEPDERFAAEQERIREAEQARAALIGPLEQLREGLHARTAGEKLCAMTAYLDRIGLAAALEAKAERLLAEERPREAQEHGTVWKALKETLEMMYEILGDMPVSREDFLSVFEEGLSMEMARVVPDTADRVLAGDAAHTVLSGNEVKTLFLIGANEGMLPKDRHDDGLLSDHELRVLKDCGIDIENDGTGFCTALDRYAVYLAVSAPRERLVFCYSLTSGSGGSEALPAGFLGQLRESMPGLETRLHRGETNPVSERLGFRMLAEQLRDEIDWDRKTRTFTRKRSAETEALRSYFAACSEYAAHTAAIEKIATGIVSSDPLGREIAARLYRIGAPMSASRLESFNRCPFRLFAESGLKAQRREEAEMRPNDIGTMFHSAAEMFIKYCVDNHVDFGSLTEEETSQIADKILAEVFERTNHGLLLSDERMHAALFLTVETVKTAVQAIVLQLRSGDYRPLAAEAHFGTRPDSLFGPIELDLGPTGKIRLEGIIDRVDTAETGGKTLFRIVDYKTFGRTMEYGKFAAGVTLQLPLYMLAAIQNDADALPGGMYYMKVLSDPVAEEKDEDDIYNALRLTGITPDDPEVLLAAESKPGQGASAVLSGVKYVKDGGVSKNSAVCGPGGMRRMLAHAKKSAEETAARLFGGEIAVAPIEKACTYCDHRAVCGFDAKLPSCRVRVLDKYKRDEFFEMLLKQEGKEKSDGNV
ncbi:MAG: PD-(D/E)XK nuclease family protein [Clostridia bacterium]|nr:PD-(D/E)XK nuclease family protein [Clostridia bacterium]